MREYNDEESNGEQHNIKTKFKEKKEVDELDLENKFEPLDEERDSEKDLVNVFEPHDENENYDKLFREEFTPKDENKSNYDQFQLEFPPKEYVKDQKDLFIPEKNPEFAEMTGIILGDGNIYINEDIHKYYLRIYSNRLEEKEYNSYVNQQIKKIFNISPRIEDRKESAGTALIVEKKAIVKGLIETGLEAGNKVQNQVRIPKWIESSNQNKIECTRGLVDTDGSIYIRNCQNAIGINFKNGSYPLVKDFKKMCESLDIKTQKIPKPKIYINPDTGEKFKTFQVTIEDKSQITKFINTIQPKKWVYRAETLGLALLSHKDPAKRELIQRELNILYPDKKIHYTSEYKEILKNLCQKHGYEVNKEAIIESMKFSLHDKRKPFDNLDYELVKLIEGLDDIL